MTNFSFVPKIVRPKKPQYNVVQTPSERTKTQRQLYPGRVEIYELDFGEVQLADTRGTLPSRNQLYEHYSGEHGEYSGFSWTNPPSYVNGGNAIDVHYEDYDEEPLEDGNGEVWAVTVVLRREVQ